MAPSNPCETYCAMILVVLVAGRSGWGTRARLLGCSRRSGGPGPATRRRRRVCRACRYTAVNRLMCSATSADAKRKFLLRRVARPHALLLLAVAALCSPALVPG